MKKRYAWHADVLDISSRMHNFDVFLMADAYWRFIVNSLGRRREMKYYFNEITKRTKCIKCTFEHNPQEREESDVHAILASIIAMKEKFEKLQGVTWKSGCIEQRDTYTARDQTGRSDELWLQWL